MSAEAAVGAPEPMEEAPRMTNAADDDDDDQDDLVMVEDGLVTETETDVPIDLDYIDLRATTLKSLMGGWCLHAFNHIKQDPENVLRGWRDSGLLDAWKSHTIGEAHTKHSKGMLWPEQDAKQNEDEGAFPLSRTDEKEEEERRLNASEDEVLEIPADGVVQTRSGITYPLDPHNYEGLFNEDDTGFVEGMQAEMFQVLPEMSITKRGGVKRASNAKAAGRKKDQSRVAPTLKGADRIIGLHWTEGDEDDIEMRLLYVGVDRHGVFHGWAFPQPPPAKVVLPKRPITWDLGVGITKRATSSFFLCHVQK